MVTLGVDLLQFGCVSVIPVYRCYFAVAQSIADVLASLSWLIEKAKKSGKDFGSSESLLAEYKIIKRRMLGNDKLDSMTEVSRWNKVCRSSVYYSGCENILNLALACFIKSPNESIVESVGSLITQHGSCHGKKSRSR